MLSYTQQVSKHSKTDAIIALGFFAYFILRDFAVSLIYAQFNLSAQVWWSLIAATCVVDILLVFAIVKLRKQSLASIGLHKQKLWAALGFGLCFAPIFLLQRVAQGTIVGWTFAPFGSFLFSLMSVTLWAVREDISFVGFIQTRLHGLVKHEARAINVGAALFALAHVPFRLVQGIPMGGMMFMLLLVNWFFMHRAFVLLLKKHYSLAPVFVMHVASNFPGLWQGDSALAWWWVAIPTVVFCLAVELWHGRWNKPKHTLS